MHKYLEINMVIEIMLNWGIESRQGWSGTLVAPNGACPGHSNKYLAAWRGAHWGRREVYSVNGCLLMSKC
jgi:hypothetical protein